MRCVTGEQRQAIEPDAPDAPDEQVGEREPAEQRVPADFPWPVVLGIDVLIDPSAPPFVIFLVHSQGTGLASLPAPIPNRSKMIGFKLNGQFFWQTIETRAPCPPLRLASSNAIAVTIQP